MYSWSYKPLVLFNNSIPNRLILLLYYNLFQALRSLVPTSTSLTCPTPIFGPHFQGLLRQCEFYATMCMECEYFDRKHLHARENSQCEWQGQPCLGEGSPRGTVAQKCWRRRLLLPSWWNYHHFSGLNLKKIGLTVQKLLVSLTSSTKWLICTSLLID